MKTFSLLFLMLFSAFCAFGQFKLGDKSTVGQTWSADGETGKCVLTTNFNPDKDPSSYVMDADTATISLAKCQTNKGLQIEVRDTSGNKVYNGDFKCKSYRSYDNPVYVESVASLIDILNQYENNEAVGYTSGNTTSDSIPAHCIFKVADGGTNGDGAFGAWPGQWKNVKYDFYYKFSGYAVTEDLTFDISTVYPGSDNLGGATATYSLYLKVGSFRDTIENIYTTGEAAKTVNLATVFDQDPSIFSGQSVYIQLFTEGTGTEIAADKFDPVIGIDNMVAKCEAAVWVAPAAGIQGNITLNNDTLPETGVEGVEKTFALKLQTKGRNGSFKIVDDLQNQMVKPITFLNKGAVKANDGEGNYTVDVDYSMNPSVFDGEKWSKAQIEIAAPTNGAADDDFMVFFTATPSADSVIVNRFELDCGTRIWFDYNIKGYVAKKIGYFNYDKEIDASASTLDNDPIIQMLKADPNFDVDVQLVAADATVDLSGYDAVVVQEGFSSGAQIYTPAGALALEKLTVPSVYNKSYAFRNDKGVTSATSSASEIEGELYLEVSADNQSNPLFSGVAFEGDSVAMFFSGAADNGDNSRTKALNYTLNLEMSDANTLLGKTKGGADEISICVNDIPAGTVVGTEDTLQARMITISQNTGAINFDMGSNMTDANLTLWRNAVYLASGLEVPTTGFSNSSKVSNVTASVGTLTTTSDGVAQLVLPVGTTTAELDFELVNEAATVKMDMIAVADGDYKSYQAVVYAPVGTDSTVYSLDVHVQTADEILYVSSNGDGVYAASADYDKNVVDMLTDAGYSVTFAKRTAIFEWTADGVVPFDYTPYKGMVLSGGTGSSNVNDYAKRNYPIPCVTMQNDGPKNNKWGWINDKNAAQFNATKVYDVETAKIKITNTSHYITKDYTVGDLVQWSLGTPDSADWAGKEIKSFNLTDSISEAVALATIPADGNAHTNLWAIPAGASVRSMNGDYATYERVTTTSRVVLMSLFNDGLLYASDDLSPLLIRSLEWVLGAEDVVVKKVAYVTSDKTMAETASPASYDPIIRMLDADPKIDLTVMAVAADADLGDLSGYDVVVAQEGFGSGSDIFKPGNSLALSELAVPFVYNKTYALRDGKAVGANGGASGEVAGLEITVDVANQTNDLFSGIAFAGNNVALFKATAADDGTSGGTKALNYTSGLTLGDATTLLATATEVTDAATTIFVNDIPAGTMIGDQVTKARMIAFGMNFGAICAENGTNITDEGLTIWRNAVYLAAGLEVPAELVIAADPLALDATLSEITATVGEFDQTFDPAVTDYILSVPAGTMVVNIAATATDANATVVGGGNVVTVSGSGNTSFTVTAENGMTTKTYNVSVTIIDAVNEAVTEKVTVVPTVSAEDFEVTATAGSVIEIFDITGQLVSAIAADSNKTSVEIPQAGIYMIKVGDSVTKVVKVD